MHKVETASLLTPDYSDVVSHDLRFVLPFPSRYVSSPYVSIRYTSISNLRFFTLDNSDLKQTRDNYLPLKSLLLGLFLLFTGS